MTRRKKEGLIGLTKRQFLQSSSAIGALPLIGMKASSGTAQEAGTIRFLAPAEDVSVYVQKTIVPKFKAETGITVLVDQVEYNSLYTKEVLEFGAALRRLSGRPGLGSSVREIRTTSCRWTMKLHPRTLVSFIRT